MNSGIVSNISYDQTEILHNIGMLHNGGSDWFDADMTASSLGFYNSKKSKFCLPEPLVLMDVNPTRSDIIKIEPFVKLPLRDSSIKSIVCDLPFCIKPKHSIGVMSDRFSAFYPTKELIDNIYFWLKECYRVIADNGIVIWKMQSVISGGVQIWSVPFSFMAATKIGFYVADEFILAAKNRLISFKAENQLHARKYTSTFYVFKKDDRKAKKTNCLDWLKEYN